MLISSSGSIKLLVFTTTIFHFYIYFLIALSSLFYICIFTSLFFSLSIFFQTSLFILSYCLLYFPCTSLLFPIAYFISLALPYCTSLLFCPPTIYIRLCFYIERGFPIALHHSTALFVSSPLYFTCIHRKGNRWEWAEKGRESKKHIKCNYRRLHILKIISKKCGIFVGRLKSQ